MRRGCAVALCVLTVAWTVGDVAAQQGPTPYTASVDRQADQPKVNAATSTNWSDHNADLANTRYSPLTQITPANAGRLGLKWSFELPKGDSIAEQTPLVIDGVMYFNSGSKLYALDAVTGKHVWTFQMQPAFGGGKRQLGLVKEACHLDRIVWQNSLLANIINPQAGHIVPRLQKPDAMLQMVVMRLFGRFKCAQKGFDFENGRTAVIVRQV